MASDHFDSEEARKFLTEKEKKERDKWEQTRHKALMKVTLLLQEEFKNSTVEVYLIGSILRPFLFTPRSDIDIVLKNYQGDRFSLWANLERKIEQKLEVILFETCPFQELVIKEGLRVH